MNLKSPGNAILWEIGRKNHRVFLGLLAFNVAWALINFILHRAEVHSSSAFVEQAFRDREGVSLGILLISTISLIFLFSFTENNSRNGFSGPPARLFASPVSTFTLVTAPMIAAVAVLLLFQLGWAFLILRPTGILFPVVGPMVGLAAAMTSLQMIVWSLNSFPKIRAGSLVVWVVGVLATSPALLGLTENHATGLFIACLGAIVPISYLVTLQAVKNERAGVWESMSWPTWLENLFANRFSRPVAGFSSPGAAQFWIEWRRNGALPLAVLALGMILLAGLFLAVFQSAGPEMVGILALLLVEFFVVVSSATIGIMLARDASTGTLAMSSFVAVRPMSTGALAGAKLRLAALAAIVACILFLALIGPWFSYFAQHPDGTQWLNNRVGSTGLSAGIIDFTILAIGWNIAGFLPLWLRGRVKNASWAGLIYLSAFIVFLNVAHYLLEYHAGQLLAWFPWIVGIALLIKILVAAWTFQQAQRRQLLSRRAILAYIGTWLILTLILFGIGIRVSVAAFAPSEDGYLLPPLVLLVVPIARVGLSVLALDLNRHR